MSVNINENITWSQLNQKPLENPKTNKSSSNAQPQKKNKKTISSSKLESKSKRFKLLSRMQQIKNLKLTSKLKTNVQYHGISLESTISNFTTKPMQTFSKLSFCNSIITTPNSNPHNHSLWINVFCSILFSPNKRFQRS